ncbi:MAG: 2-oxoacid:acceptor oxidoreductase family protein [Candidatus Thorarchaeota archaeon]
MRTEVRIAGTGGMGVVLAGVLLGHAAVVHADLDAIQTQSYGSEARGTAAKSEVIISDEPIRYPKVIKADYSIFMSQKAFDMYLSGAKPNSTLLIDPNLVKCDCGDTFNVVPVPAMKTADDLGSRMISNMIMLGAFAKQSGIISLDALEAALRDIVPERTLEMNIRGLHAGASFVK